METQSPGAACLGAMRRQHASFETQNVIRNTDLRKPKKGSLRPAYVLRARGEGGAGVAAYDDHYFSFEGEETLEIPEVSLGFCFGGHDLRRLLKSLGNSVHTDRRRIGVKED